ncbi:MAG: SH3 domain-containing protein, partial [Fibrobacterota bacterium]
MKGLLLVLTILLLVIPVQSVERIDPTLYICFAKEIVIHKEPQTTSESSGNLLFGMPAVAMARHNDWLGVYLRGGGKGWIQASDMASQKDFIAQYPHLTVNDAFTAQLIKEAVQSTVQKRSDNKLGELKFMKVFGESEEIYVRKDNVIIRSKPSLNARPIRNTFLGEAFIAAGMVRGFYKIEYDEGKFGWIAEDQISPDTIEYLISMENAAGTPKEATVYVMKTPDEKAAILARARRDFQYEILTEKASWYKIRLDSLRSGWVPMQDFRITRPGLKNPTPSAETPVIKPSHTGQASGIPSSGPADSNISSTPPPAPVAVPDTPLVKTAKEIPATSSPFAKLDSL